MIQYYQVSDNCAVFARVLNGRLYQKLWRSQVANIEHSDCFKHSTNSISYVNYCTSGVTSGFICILINELLMSS